MLDADILILLRRQVPTAEAWLSGLPSRPPVCGYAALELLFGCQNTKETQLATPLYLICATEKAQNRLSRS